MIALALAAGIFTTVFVVLNRRCVADGSTICYDKDEGYFKVEADVSLKVQVESEAMGAYLVSTWDRLHPEQAGAVSYEVRPLMSAAELSGGMPYDVFVVAQETASYYIDDLLAAEALGRIVDGKIPTQLQDVINQAAYYFTSNSIAGNVFVYNETLMEELGYDTSDNNQSGLPDIFDSWEAIFEQADDLTEKTELLFPFTLTDQNSIYPFLTGAGWSLFFNKDSMNPGFSSREFKDGLSLIEDFSNTALIQADEEENEEITPYNGPITPLDRLPWQFEDAFYNRRTLFSVLNPSDELFIQYSRGSDTYKLAPMPSYKKHTLMPMASVTGYVIKGDIEFPSAASEIVRILRLPEGLMIYQNNSMQTIVYKFSLIDDLALEDQALIDRIRAYNYHDVPFVLALKGNPQVLARSIWKEIDIMPSLIKLYNHEISPDQAQQEIMELSERWYEAKELR